ncbi:MAG TPA: AAC(3) family N-acetyltransferase [Ilumatobacteraceae bacterium]|nr:AAC(3) family N-acetyltransferase [Ilumatobacteraceae bacterium]
MSEAVSATDEPWAGEAAAIARTDAPVTRAAVVGALRAVGVQPAGLIIVHSSLSRLGWVVGGAHTVVSALAEAVTPDGTIVMPSLSSNLGEPSRWEAPPVPASWWQTIRDEMPAYDSALTPMTGMGSVAECFRHLPGTQRSAHPAISLMANGPLAHQVVHPHEMTAGFGDSSPLGRLYELDARIVLVGVGHSNNTSLHLAESRTRWAREHSITFGVPVMSDGERRWVTYDDVDYDNHDFEAAGAAFAATGGEARVPLGAGELISCRMRDIVDFATEWLDYSRGTTV